MIDRGPQTLDDRSAARCRVLSRLAAVLAGAIGISVLLGWGLDYTPLVRFGVRISNYPVPNTAVCLILGATSLWLSGMGARWGPAHLAALGCAALVALIAAASVVEHVLDTDVGIDGVVLGEALRRNAPEMSGRIGWTAAFMLLAAGTSLLLLRTRSMPALAVSTVGTVSTLLFAMTSLLGFWFWIPGGSPFWSRMGMSAQASVAGLALGSGIILSRPDRPLLATIISPLAGGQIARRVLVVAVALPILMAAVHSLAVRSSGIDPDVFAAVQISVVIVVVCTVLLVACAALNRSDQRRYQAEESRARMLDELDHRVKNTLATVLAACDQTAAGHRGTEAFRAAFRGRVQAMARAHEALAASRWRGACLRRVAETTVGAYDEPSRRRVTFDGPDVLLSARSAAPIAATLHELATNAVKHGALSPGTAGGRIAVQWRAQPGGGVVVDWSETGGPQRPATEPLHDGLGTSIIRGLVAHELKGSTELTIDASGVRCRISLPSWEAGRVET